MAVEYTLTADGIKEGKGWTAFYIKGKGKSFPNVVWEMVDYLIKSKEVEFKDLFNSFKPVSKAYYEVSRTSDSIIEVFIKGRGFPVIWITKNN